MNGKKARALRRLARESSVGLPERVINEVNKHLKFYPFLKRVHITTQELLDNGIRQVCQHVNSETGFRGQYKTAKRYYALVK